MGWDPAPGGEDRLSRLAGEFQIKGVGAQINFPRPLHSPSLAKPHLGEATWLPPPRGKHALTGERREVHLPRHPVVLPEVKLESLTGTNLDNLHAAQNLLKSKHRSKDKWLRVSYYASQRQN